MPDNMSGGSSNGRNCTAAEQDSFLEGGYARLSHFESPVQKEYFAKLEELSGKFTAMAWTGGRYGYPWPLDPLHWWSRIWEYPFLAAQLARLPKREPSPRLLDIGAAVTFFSFHLLRQGYHLMNLYYDASMPRHFARVFDVAAAQLDCHRRPPYLVADARNTELPDESFDVILSVSVLEHIPEWPRAIEEVHRLLRPGGHFMLTFDAQLDGKGEGLSANDITRLLGMLDKGWKPWTSRSTGRPPDALHMKNSPSPVVREPARIQFWPPKAVARELYRRLVLPVPPPPENICIFGGVWEKQ